MGSFLISLPQLEHKDLSWHLHWRAYHALGLSSPHDCWRCHWLCSGKAGQCDVPLQQQSRRNQEHGVLPQICKLCHTQITWQRLLEIPYFIVFLPIQFWQNFIVVCPDKFDPDWQKLFCQVLQHHHPFSHGCKKPQGEVPAQSSLDDVVDVITDMNQTRKESGTVWIKWIWRAWQKDDIQVQTSVSFSKSNGWWSTCGKTEN